MRLRFHRCDEPFVPRSDRLQVLGSDGFQGAASFNLIPLNPSQDTNIIRRIDIDTQIEYLPQLRAGK